MGVGFRDVVFLAVVLGATGIMGAGLAAFIGIALDANHQSQWRLDRISATIVEEVDRSFRRSVGRAKAGSGRPRIRAGRDAPAGAGALRLGPLARRDPPLRGQARGRACGSWLDDLLADRRCADYLAERFARAFVGTEDGPFLLFRRRRFIAWLSDALLENRPYDALVTRADRRPGPVDRSPRDQFRLRHV